VCRIEYLACQGEFFVNIPLYVKENDERIPYFAPHSLAFSGLT
jgi:hypothetical protein